MASDYKKAQTSETTPTQENIKVKFNFPLASNYYDSSLSLQKAREEKSYVAFELQNHIDLNTTTNFYEAGKVYDVPVTFYNKFSARTVETYGKYFGKIDAQTKKLAERPKVPYMLKVDELGNLLDPMQQKLDLYSNEY